MSGRKRKRIFVNYTQDDFENGKIRHNQFTRQYEEKNNICISSNKLNFYSNNNADISKQNLSKLFPDKQPIVKPKAYKFIDYAPKPANPDLMKSPNSIADVYLTKLNQYRSIVPKVATTTTTSFASTPSFCKINTIRTPMMTLNKTPFICPPVSGTNISISNDNPDVNVEISNLSDCSESSSSSLPESPQFGQIIIKDELLDDSYQKNAIVKKKKCSFVQILEHLHDVAKDRNQKEDEQSHDDDIQELHYKNDDGDCNNVDNVESLKSTENTKLISVSNANIHIVKPFPQRKQTKKCLPKFDTNEQDLALSLVDYCHQVVYHLVQNRFPTLQMYSAENDGKRWLVVYPNTPYFFHTLGPFTDYIRLVIKSDETYNFQVLHQITQSGQFDRKTVKKVLEIMTCSTYTLCVGLTMLSKYKDWIEQEQEILIRKWPELNRVDSHNCLLWHHASHRLSPDSEIHHVCRKCREILYSLKRKQYMAKDGYYCHTD